MYVTGGITDKGYSSEVWKYNLDTKQWQMGQVLQNTFCPKNISYWCQNEEIYYFICEHVNLTDKRGLNTQ